MHGRRSREIRYQALPRTILLVTLNNWEGTKEFYRNPLVGNLENLAKIMQVGIFCHINLKRSQEIGNKQTKYCNPRAHARRALISTHLKYLIVHFR